MQNNKHDTGMAYLLWALSLIGVCGIHRFYMNKPASGIVWFFTLGLLGIGTIYDLFTLPSQIKVSNINKGKS